MGRLCTRAAADLRHRRPRRHAGGVHRGQSGFPQCPAQHGQHQLRCLRAGRRPAGGDDDRRVRPEAGAGAVVDHLARRPDLHLQAAAWREVAVECHLPPDARHECRRRGVQLPAHVRQVEPVLSECQRHFSRIQQPCGARPAIDREDRRRHGGVQAEIAAGAAAADAVGAAVLDPVRRVRGELAEIRQARRPGPEADRHRTVQLRSVPERRGGALPGLPRVLGQRRRAARSRGEGR